ncbi:hypothetical protein E4T56_gene18321 [Termitomyces sp. T112]|nr:hypothetical protein E4T56_gene18321 [Termitomyces sp. T112]
MTPEERRYIEVVGFNLESYIAPYAVASLLQGPLSLLLATVMYDLPVDAWSASGIASNATLPVFVLFSVSTVQTPGEILIQTRDRIICVGELMACRTAVSALQSCNIPARWTLSI